MQAKEKIQYACAVLAIVAGLVLNYISYFICHDLTEKTLFFLGECFIFAGGVFGITLYFRDTGKGIVRDVEDALRKERRRRRKRKGNGDGDGDGNGNDALSS